ncbi:MAG: GNAT family N-acetyltransferase [Nocardioidaceae bacterium]
MLGGSGLAVVATPFEDPATQAMVSHVQAEYVRRYGGPDETPLPDGVFEPPAGAFFLGLEDGAPVAMGGWRLRTDVQPWGLSPVAEIKRMYVAAASRRRGHARRVLAHLEQTARAAGARAMVLETGVAQPEAIGLYTAAGYAPVPAFGHYAWSPSARHLGKRL